MVDRAVVNDKRLSFSAIGVYAYIQSFPIGSAIDEEELNQPEAVAELRQYGYLEP
jgi:hypothetical protein